MRAIRAAAGLALSMGLVAGVTGCSQHNEAASDHQHATASVVASTNVWGSVASAVDRRPCLGEVDHLQPRRRPALVRGHPGRRRRDRRCIPGRLQRRRLRPLGRRRAVQPSGRPAVDAYSLLPSSVPQPANEHVFYDLETAKAVANQIADKLSQSDAEHTDDYKANASKFADEADTIAAAERAIGARTRVLQWWRPSPSPTTCWSTPESSTRPQRDSPRRSNRTPTRRLPTWPPCST